MIAESTATEAAGRLAADGGDAVICTENLTKVFGRFTAVDSLTLRVRRGEIFGLLGPNGAGKSTTIRMLCGLLSSTRGSASVAGFDINRQPEQVRQNIGYMSQKFSLFRELTVAENLAFFGGVYGLRRSRLRERAAEVVRTAGLAGYERHLTGTLSGALQQRVALACAILHEPPILFLDEPTSGVDPVSRRAFWDLIQDMAGRGVTVLITTHFMDEAEFCERIAFISGGKLAALDTPAALRHGAVREDLFEIATPELGRARERMEGLAGVVACSYFGQRLHAFCAPGAFTEATLAARLEAEGLAVERVQRVPVRLEDAFLRLVQ